MERKIRGKKHFFIYNLREGFKKINKKIIEFSIKVWVGGSGGSQILLKKIKNKHAFKIQQETLHVCRFWKVCVYSNLLSLVGGGGW